MNLREIEERVAAIEPRSGVEFLEDLLRAYGLPKMSVARLMSGSTDKAGTAHERLLKNKVYFQSTDAGDDDLYTLIDAARDDDRVLKHKPRFLIVKNRARLVARDQSTGETLDIAGTELGAHSAFFGPWAGFERTQLENINYADVRAAEKMAKLYDEVIKHNSIETEDDIHALNVFFSRLLFCFFAEDTGVFEESSFTNAIGSHTRESGEDAHEYLDQLFRVLNEDHDERDGVPAHLMGFGYVNGNLFAHRSRAPRFSAKARALILECGTLDWSQINPDIFGSMIQAVVHPSHREGLGMHYTSVENIMKVIRPLFLDDLHEALKRADTSKKLERLLERIADIQIFDPACGSGNFLVISYKELRKIEHRILQRLVELDLKGLRLFRESVVNLQSLYGIEIDDFAHEIAILSLWLAKHQMNVEFKELFGAEIPLIPLKETSSIVCANAARADWSAFCDPAGREVYLLGNPPYQGGTRQSPEQKEDLQIAFGDTKVNKYLDYVSIWLYKGAQFVSQHGARLGFVTTNSVSQGNHVALLWPRLLATGVEVAFAHAPFPWSNAARGNAGVICVVVGLAPVGAVREKLYATTDSRQYAKSINAYLVPNGANVIVHQAKASIAGLSPMVFGSMPRDGGHLILEEHEADALMAAAPETRAWLRRYGGAREAISGRWRACLWIPDDDAEAASAIPEIAARLRRVTEARRASDAASTRAFAAQPHRFVQRAHKETPAIIVPRVSSERREYVPLDFVGGDTVISDLANAIYGAEIWLFGLIQSRMHMVWMRAVAGRLKNDIRYAASLVYNTFPPPELGDESRAMLVERGSGVLKARELFPDLTLGDLYDPERMPDRLRGAHRDLDGAVDGLYQGHPFESDEDRLRVLLELYELRTAPLTA